MMSSAPKKNPFAAPYDEHLYISDLTDDYVLLFNKYCICENHVLAVTREFEEQTAPLAEKDFFAASIALKAMDGFVYYNSGPNSGASVRHRHL